MIPLPSLQRFIHNCEEMPSLSNRLKTCRFFSVSELIILFLGKILPLLRSVKFNHLQDFESKLNLLNGIGARISVLNDEVYVEWTNSTSKVSCFLRLSGSDVWAFNQVFVNKSYEIILSKFLENFGTSPVAIIDAGANIGLTSIFFITQNPQSRILSIEPDDKNQLQMIRNLECNSISGVSVRLAALWPVNKRLQIRNDFRDKFSWSLRVEESFDGKIQTITPTEAIQFFENQVDLLKIDIEGSEFEIFNEKNSLAWLEEVRMIAVEVHEEFGSTRDIVSVLEKNGFETFCDGELTIGINHRLKH